MLYFTYNDIRRFYIMAIKEDKSRVMITMSNELRNTIEESAKKNKRSLSSEIEFALDGYYNSKDIDLEKYKSLNEKLAETSFIFNETMEKVNNMTDIMKKATEIIKNNEQQKE
jgi:hypothetical protein